MRQLAVRVRFLTLLLSLPTYAQAQGQQTKIHYDDAFNWGSQAFVEGHSEYFQVLTTPAAEDPDGALIDYWGPQLDHFFENVCDNLRLTADEVQRYLLYPDFFAQVDQLVLERRLHAAYADSLLQRLRDRPRRQTPGSAIPAGTEDAPFRLVEPTTVPTELQRGVPRARRWEERYTEWQGDTLLVWLPPENKRLFQRCVLYRTLHDFLATPIGPVLPEGVLGFVPRHDPELPIVIYASLGEERLRRTAQHEIAHAVIETIAKYHRRLAVARIRNAGPNQHEGSWKPQKGGFSAITHENFAEYLSFPHGQMDPSLRAALIELVAENRLDGLAALSVGARTLASSYVEGPARLTFLASRFGRDTPKLLLHGYYTHSTGFLNVLEDVTGYSIEALEQLYRRWLRDWLWSEYLTTAVPDTIGEVIASALSGVERNGQMLVQRARAGRQEIALTGEGADGRNGDTRVIVRELEGIERLPLFTSPDLRRGRVVTVVRNQNRESLLLWERGSGCRQRELSELGAVREVRDPRFSPDATQVVFRVVDRSGRNALGLLDLENDKARLLTDWQWTEVSDPDFAGDNDRVLYSSTATPDRHADVFLLQVASGDARNVTQTPYVSETEPVWVNDRLLCFSDRSGVPLPIEWLPGGRSRQLLKLPFAMSGLECGDSTLTLVANSLRHRNLPARRALWSFPLRRLALDSKPAESCMDNWPTLAPPVPQHGVLPGIAAVTEALIESTRQADTTPAGTAAGPEIRPPVQGSAPTSPEKSEPRGATPELPATLVAAHDAVDGVGIVVHPYKQKWRLMPLGINLSNTEVRARGVSFLGLDTEFHDQSFLLAAGQSGDFDRFGTLLYRNRAARTHWEAGIFHRSIVRGRFAADSTGTFDRNERETGIVLGAQYHQNLTTRFGLTGTFAQRTDTDGTVVVRQPEAEGLTAEAPVLGLSLGGFDPRAWRVALGGLADISVLATESRVGLAQFENAGRELAAGSERDFIPSVEYVRSNATLGASFSRDTRVWSDYRGPRSGTLVTLAASLGFNAPGHQTDLDVAQQDSLQQHVAAGLDRVGVAGMFLTHVRLAFLDVAWRLRGFANNGDGELIYGLGGLHSVAGYSRGFVRSPRILYSNFETRVPLWNYSSLRLPLRPLVLPAGDGFFFADAGAAEGARRIYSYGVGLRLRLGFLAYEWRHLLRDGLRNQNGLTLSW